MSLSTEVPCCAALVLLHVLDMARATVVAQVDYGGVPLRIDRLLGEPSVFSLRGRLDRAWFRANNPEPCPELCDCPVHWPTALYCDHRGLEEVSGRLPARTQYLFLQGNNISALSSSSLLNVTGLRWLILDHNRLQSDELEPTALRNQTELVFFFASHNHLSAVPAGLPAGLRQLRLAHNRISSIGAGALQDLRNLTLLLLQGNRLSAIAEGDLGGLLSLNLLDLSGNLFVSVPGPLPPSVQQLDLSNNSLSGLEKDSFAGFSSLKYLRLSRCLLRSDAVHSQVFNFSSLVELDLSYNRLSSIPTVSPMLQHLYLQANQIREFNVTSFCREVGPTSYSRMEVLRLEGNKMSPQHLPLDWGFCLRALHSMFL